MRTNRNLRLNMCLLTLIALLAVLMTGCDGLFGNDGDAPQSIEGVGTLYFPVVEGLQLSYVGEVYDGADVPRNIQKAFSAPEMHLGQQAWKFTESVSYGSYSSSSATYYSVNDDTLYYSRASDSTWHLCTEYVDLTTATNAGDTLRCETNFDQAVLKKDSLVTTVVSMNATVAVAAGEFSGCLYTLTKTRHDEYWNLEPIVELNYRIRTEVHSWYAPNIGLVKRLSYDSCTFPLDCYSSAMELVDYIIPE